MSCQECLASQPAGFVVRTPVPSGQSEWLVWVRKQGIRGGENSWELEMTPWGLPLSVQGSTEMAETPVLLANPGRSNEGKYYCRTLVQSDGKGGMKLSKFGRQTMEMMLYAGPTPSP